VTTYGIKIARPSEGPFDSTVAIFSRAGADRQESSNATEVTGRTRIGFFFFFNRGGARKVCGSWWWSHIRTSHYKIVSEVLSKW